MENGNITERRAKELKRSDEIIENLTNKPSRVPPLNAQYLYKGVKILKNNPNLNARRRLEEKDYFSDLRGLTYRQKCKIIQIQEEGNIR